MSYLVQYLVVRHDGGGAPLGVCVCVWETVQHTDKHRRSQIV